MAVETLVASSENVLAPKKNRIQVSNTKKPLFFYVNLAKVCSFSCRVAFSFIWRGMS